MTDRLVNEGAAMPVRAGARIRLGAGLAAGGLLAVAVAGCAGRVEQAVAPEASSSPVAAGPQGRLSGAPQIQPRWRSCAEEPSLRDGSVDPGVLPLLAADFRPVAAVACREDVRRRPDGGSDATAVEDRAEQVAALVAALRRPDEPGPSPGVACTADGFLAPRLVLLDARGRWVRPGIPVNACGKPYAEFMTAMSDTGWRRVATRVRHEAESAEAAASGCGDVYADMVWTMGLDASGRRGELAPLAGEGASVRLCVYRVEPGERGGDKPAGRLVSGGLLPPARWAAVRREIQGSAPAAPCSTPAGRFALLDTARGVLSLELDGCRRLLGPAAASGDGTGSDTLRQGSAGLAALLDGR